MVNKEWLKAAGIRAVKTFAQALAAQISIDAAVGFSEIAWLHLISVAGVAAVYSLITSLAGIPEVK